ncbi:hypothetical protein WN55_09840 [Dufourea novaeangliae]|uniref:Uncharacterized protein n=1 Tax=Dufourea novaeangliae TaxID=178035 RepID=A0A154P8Z7_DUFNO|nr:hypothetical protein WN55_09840 [Dufourea novaeangliae]
MHRSTEEWNGGDHRRQDYDRRVVLHLDDSQVEGAEESAGGLEEGITRAG